MVVVLEASIQQKNTIQAPHVRSSLDQIGVLSIVPGKQSNTCTGKRSRPNLKIASQEKDGLLHGTRESLIPPRELGAQTTSKMGPQRGAWPGSLFSPTDLRHPLSPRDWVSSSSGKWDPATIRVSPQLSLSPEERGDSYQLEAPDSLRTPCSFSGNRERVKLKPQ